MSTDPDRIRDDIARTRSELSSDVDALTERVRPVNVARRQGERVHETFLGLKNRIVAGPSDGTGATGSAASSLGEKASGLPDAARSGARDNPLAAGLVAFGVGWLASSLLPRSRQEQRLAPSARDQPAPPADAASAATTNVRAAGPFGPDGH
ncbi:DUF3618 domain-containing protein [Cellulomonas sp. URHE0023]|uniref:DUF3618 domain-containing protein n=1 Tax=Cellulomonas sp. URHE0023 TaxID=1380354 RepID=UPI0006923253|nr:DUF3618 domain-containing protein [Cellulomonas sp. URHE0023]